MEPLVAGAVLGAALLHASWHALVKSSGDRVVALAGMNLVSGAVALAFVPFVRVPVREALLVIAGAVFLHSGYKIALAALYDRADLSRAYPLARGVTPLLAMALAFLMFSEMPSAWTLSGVLLVSVGISGLVLETGAARLATRTLAAAAAAGAMVAAYSVVDAYGVRLNGDWLGFTVWLVLCDSILFIAFALSTRPGAMGMLKKDFAKTLVSGTLGVVSFTIFIWALGRAQVGAVTALRETSILFAALIGTAFLKEPLTAARLVSAALVMAGTAAVAVTR